MSMEDFDFKTPNEALVNLFVSAKEDIAEILKEGLESQNTQRLIFIEAQINGVMQQLRDNSNQWVADILPSIYERAVDESIDDLAKVGITSVDPLQLKFAKLNAASVGALALNTQEDLIDSINSSQRTLFRKLRRTQQQSITDAEISEQLGIAATLGETPEEQADRILQALGRPLEVTVKGRTYDAEFYSRLVAITRTREAATQGVISTMAVNGRDLVKVSSHPHKKDICTPFDGKVFSITGRSRQFPALSSIPNDGPPFHPNCRHVLLPFVETLATEPEIDRASGINQKFLNVDSNAKLDRLVKNSPELREIKRGKQPSI